jgi:5-methylcytosine-specific restriction endonuclease McrA
VENNHLIAFAERVITLLERASFAATYKYAVLLALMDLCMEKAQRDGGPPESVTTRQLAEKVIELYWPQTSSYRGRTLRQNSGRQARIISDICQFRAAVGDPTGSLQSARIDAQVAFDRLVRKVEWTLILMPLPRLQVVGGDVDRLIYEIGWGLEIERNRRTVANYQRSLPSNFDNRILLLPGVGSHLVSLNGLLRPLIHRAWSAMVAQFNGLEQSRLESFLFGIERSALNAIRPHLMELQSGACFYCGRRGSRDGQVDHFIPWSRYPDNGIENLVLADAQCNRWKRDFLAARQHVSGWRTRNAEQASALSAVAAEKSWPSHAADTLGVARSIYLRLPSHARLWLRKDEFSAVGTEPLDAVLA